MRLVLRLAFSGIALSLTSFALPPTALEEPTLGQLDPAPAQLAFSDSNLWVDTEDRDAVISLVGSTEDLEQADLDWTGSHDQCEAGQSSDELREQTIDRVNFYRALAGVPAVVTENPEFSEKAQAGALTMSAEGELSHEPTPDFACLGEFGAEAAANSNLYLGRTGPAAIDGYIEDPGETNNVVGHRLTVLHPPTREMGVGHTAAVGDRFASNVLWVFDDLVFDDWGTIREEQDFVAWPARGYITEELVYPRWSFSLNDSGFANADVSVTVNGEPVELEVVARTADISQVPPPVIVWEPQIDFDTLSGVDTEFEVTVSGVDTPTGVESYSYTVTVIS